MGNESKYSSNKYSLNFENNQELIKYLDKVNLKNIVIYVKGSHGMKLEEIRDYIIKKYPDLKSAAERRVMYSYLSTLSQLVNDEKSHFEEEKKIMDYIKSHRYMVLKDNHHLQ